MYEMQRVRASSSFKSKLAINNQQAKWSWSWSWLESVITNLIITIAITNLIITITIITELGRGWMGRTGGARKCKPC